MEVIINAIILGVIQGLTEFLPVSSSGHLEIAEAILGENEKEDMLMTIVLHFATALATIVIFRKDLKKIFSDLLLFEKNESFNFSLKIIVSMIPISLLGFLYKDQITSFFNGELILVSAMLIITGLLLLLADKKKICTRNIKKKDAILIGIAQAIALLPGVSRSGATISTSVLLGVDKEKSARFSFLMVVPVIFGMMAKTIYDGEIPYNESSLLPLFIGFIFAFLTGIFACKWMIKLVKNSQLKYFAYYCFIIGSITMTTVLWLS